MRWQFVVASVLALGGLVATFAPRFLARPGEAPVFLGTYWYVGVPLLIAAAVVFEWGWVLRKQEERERGS